MKIFIALLICITSLFAQTEKLVIDALNFETNDAQGLSIFTGNVKLLMNKDMLNSDKLEVYVKPNTKGKAKEPLKYVAIGNVYFEIFSQGKKYQGKGEKVIYLPTEKEYTIIGSGYLKEVVEDRELFGDKIMINQTTGVAKVTGTVNKPVRFILNIENGNK